MNLLIKGPRAQVTIRIGISYANLHELEIQRSGSVLRETRWGFHAPMQAMRYAGFKPRWDSIHNPFLFLDRSG